jgi:hypothetical protein
MSNSHLLQILNKQIPQVFPRGGGCQGFDLIHTLPFEVKSCSTCSYIWEAFTRAQNILNGRRSWGVNIPLITHKQHWPGKWQVHFVDRSLGIMTWQQFHLFIGDRESTFSVCLFCDQLLACNVNMGYKSIINLNPIQSLLLFGRNHILCNSNVIEN